MRNLMIFAAVMIALGTIMAQMADKMTATTPALAISTSRQTAHTQTIGQAGSRSLSISRDFRGHFLTEGRIDDGRRSASELLHAMPDTFRQTIAPPESGVVARSARRPPLASAASISRISTRISCSRPTSAAGNKAALEGIRVDT